MVYVTTFEVCGKYNFPLDMLRHDRCFPLRGEDAARIQASLERDISIREKVADQPEGFFRIRLERVSHNMEPTTGRWASFGWSVDPASISVEKLVR